MILLPRCNNAMARRIQDSLFLDSINPYKESGVYGIINRSDGRIYIGASVNLGQRMRVHRFDIRKRKHHVQNLQRDILENPNNFEFVVIEWVKDKSTLTDREQFWMDFYQSYLPEKGYNKTRFAESIIGYKHPEEMLPRFANVMKGKKRPPFSKEWCDNISASLRGRKPSAKCLTPVIQMDDNGQQINKFQSIADALRNLGKQGHQAPAIIGAIKRNYRAYGFKWAYAPKEA